LSKINFNIYDKKFWNLKKDWFIDVIMSKWKISTYIIMSRLVSEGKYSKNTIYNLWCKLFEILKEFLVNFFLNYKFNKIRNTG